MRILVNGLCGHMGQVLSRLSGEGVRGAVLAGGIDPNATGKESVPCVRTPDEAKGIVADCLIDFSHPSCTDSLLAFAREQKMPLVLATTGQSEEQRAAIRQAAQEIPLFFAANYSLGVALLIELARRAAAALPEADIEIIEKHHNRKLDAPSGTALAIAEAIRGVRPQAHNHLGRSGAAKREKDEIGIHAVRMGNVVGEHEVLLSTPSQTLTLKHEAHDRALFAEGALAAAQFLCGKGPGLYEMKDLVGN